MAPNAENFNGVLLEPKWLINYLINYCNCNCIVAISGVVDVIRITIIIGIITIVITSIINIIIIIITIIIITRPRPAFGRLGLGGSSRGYSSHG